MLMMMLTSRAHSPTEGCGEAGDSGLSVVHDDIWVRVAARRGQRRLDEAESSENRQSRVGGSLGSLNERQIAQ